MSKFSGKTDVFDLLMSMHYRCKNGSDKKEDLEKANALYNDEYECFLEFKEKTNGILYQKKKIKVTKDNVRLVAQKSNGHLEIVELPLQDKQRKHRYIYRHNGIDYPNLKELNKVDIYITLEIHFDTLLDLIPYYPYLTTAIYSDNKSMMVIISDKPYPLELRDAMLNSGINRTSMYEAYTKELQDHYKFVVQNWYTPKLENHIFEKIKFRKDNRLGVTMLKIDERFDVKWFFRDGDEKHSVWSQPKVIDYDKGIIEISEIDYNNITEKNNDDYGEAYVTYYSYKKPTLYLK